MKLNRDTPLIIKIVLIGGLLAMLLYLFHPAVGQFSIMIKGEPIAEPLIRLAALPTFFAVLFFTGILLVLAFLGIGIMVFLGTLLFLMLGIFFLAPYSWPILIIILLMIVLMSGTNRT